MHGTGCPTVGPQRRSVSLAPTSPPSAVDSTMCSRSKRVYIPVQATCWRVFKLFDFGLCAKTSNGHKKRKMRLFHFRRRAYLVIRTVPNHRICTSVRGSRLHQASMPFGKKTKLAPTEFRWVSGAPSEPLVTASAPHVETKRIADKSDSDSVAAAAAGPPLPRCASVAECVAAAAGADQTKWPSAPRFIILGVQKCGTNDPLGPPCAAPTRAPGAEA